MKNSKDLRDDFFELLEKESIRNTISSYFYYLDSRKFDLLKKCFTPDAKGEYDVSKKILINREDIIDALRVITRFKYSHHLIGSMMIEIEKDLAKTDTYAIAYLFSGNNKRGNRIIVRGLKYIDKLIKTDEGWQIVHRIHIPLWQSEMVATEPEFMLSE